MHTKNTLQEMHSHIDIKIMDALLSVLPEHWWSACMDVEYKKINEHDYGFMISIFNEDDKSTHPSPPDSIFEMLAEHLDVFEKFGGRWVRLRYRINYDEASENWRYVIDYDFADA